VSRGVPATVAGILQDCRAGMEKRHWRPSQPRLSCRGRVRVRTRELVASLAAGALLAGCTTTHTLGRIDDPGVREEVDAIAAGGDAIMHMRHPPGTRAPPFGDRVTDVSAPGLIIEPTPGQPVFVAREQVKSLSRYHHARGAGDGAIAGSLAGFLVGLTLGILLAAAAPGCSDDCGDGPDPVSVGSKAGVVLGGIAALFGAAVGALGGHEERFEIAP
jgi:hypothetical protein